MRQTTALACALAIVFTGYASPMAWATMSEDAQSDMAMSEDAGDSAPEAGSAVVGEGFFSGEGSGDVAARADGSSGALADAQEAAQVAAGLEDEAGLAQSEESVRPDAGSEAGLPDAFESSSDVRDIAKEWNAGAVRIDKAGTYVLQEDVHATGPLVISVSRGETVTLDFAGHVVEVAGNEGIVVSDARGRVSLVNSAPEYESPGGEGDDGRDASKLKPCLIVRATDPASEVRGVTFAVARLSAIEGACLSAESLSVAVEARATTAHALSLGACALAVLVDPIKGPSDPDVTVASVRDCAFSATSVLGEPADEKAVFRQLAEEGLSCHVRGLFVDGATVSLSGSFSSLAFAPGKDAGTQAAGLESTQDSAFRLEGTFRARQPLSVCVSENAPGTVVAKAASGLLVAADNPAWRFEDASGAGRAIIFDEASRAFSFAAAIDEASRAFSFAAAIDEASGVLGTQSVGDDSRAASTDAIAQADPGFYDATDKAEKLLATQGGTSVVRNAQTGAAYASLEEAIRSAGGGQRFELEADVVVNEALSVPPDVTIDLAGHIVSLRAGDSAASDSRGAALTFSGGGASALVDSVGDGALVIRVGSASEAPGKTYRGIAVTGGGSLRIDGCRVDVAYDGASVLAYPPEIVLQGLVVQGSSAVLSGKAMLNVRAAEDDMAYGASVVAGAYATAGSGAITVEDGAVVSATNNAKPVPLRRSGTSDLAEAHLDESSDLYADLQDAFYHSAKFDSNSDSSGYLYGSQVYYNISITLSNGATVSAFSDPVAMFESGTKQAVVATHLFLSANRTAPQMAYGIASDDGFVGTVKQVGTVSASTGKGSAYALLKPASVTWDTSESNLVHSSSGEDYFVYKGEFDLADYVSFSRSFDRPLVFVSQNNPDVGSLQTMRSLSAAIAVIGNEPDAVVAGGTDLAAERSSDDVRTVTITFGGMHGEDGSSLANVVAKAPFRSTMSQAGIAVPTPSDYTADGKTYRFVGWKTATSSTVYDPACLADSVKIDGSLQGAARGAVGLNAVYVPVSAGQRLVTFKVDYTLSSYAAAAGKAPSYAECLSTSSSSVEPTALVTDTGFTYTFKGWAAGWLASSSWSDGARCYGDALPEVTGDVMYTALFERSVSTISVVLYYMMNTVNGYSYAGSTERNFDWRQDAIGIANKRVRVGDTYVTEGVEHTFLGWSTRQSDTEPMYTDTLPVQYNDMMGRASVMRFGIYEENTQKFDVSFYVDGELYAQAKGVGSGQTVNAAFAGSTNPVAPVKDGDTFRGWNQDASSHAYLLGNVKTIGSLLKEGATSVELHAIWQSDVDSGSAVVSFYDEDRSTLLLRLEMPLDMTVEQYYDEDFKPSAKPGKIFTGWYDDEGERFYPAETIVLGDVTVYAAYLGEGTSVGRLGTSGSLTSGAKASGATVRTLAAKAGGNDGGPGSSAGTGSAGSLDAETVGLADEDGLTESEFDGNVAGFVAFQIVLLVAIAAVLRWFVGRRREGGESKDATVIAPEMESIRF